MAGLDGVRVADEHDGNGGGRGLQSSGVANDEIEDLQKKAVRIGGNAALLTPQRAAKAAARRAQHIWANIPRHQPVPTSGLLSVLPPGPGRAVCPPAPR